jgi:hypothetical protein
VQSSLNKIFTSSSLDYTVNVASGINKKFTYNATVTADIDTLCVIQECKFY